MLQFAPVFFLDLDFPFSKISSNSWKEKFLYYAAFKLGFVTISFFTVKR